MKEEIFAFDEHKGRKIKALVNYPVGGRVKKGEIGVLKYGNIADFPSQSGYACGVGNNFYKRFELLPEDDVDKVKKELTVNDLIEDEIYHITYIEGRDYIILSAGKAEIKKYINVKLKDFNNTGNCSVCKKIRLATPEEKKWLKVCIKQDNFIEQSALDLYDDEGNIKVIEQKPSKDDLLKQEPMKTAVHVKTSEEFDFVISKIREKSDRYNSWNVYRTESCISSDSGEYQNKDWFSKNNYKVVSFEDWCEDNEYIFVTQELKEGELKVGDYAVVLEGYCGLSFNPGNIVKLVLDEKDGFQCLCVRAPYFRSTFFIYSKDLREATTQEILAVTLPTAIVHIKNPFEITNAQENINILPKPKELEIVPISKYFKIRN